MTQRIPRPTAPPTSSFPRRGGRSVLGRETKPRTPPSGLASASRQPSGPSPLTSSERRSPVFRSPPRRSAAVSPRPSAAVAVGSVPWRRRASSTRSVVTAASPRTVPSADSPRPRWSATGLAPLLLLRFRTRERVAQPLGGNEADQPRALGAVGSENDVRRHAGHAEALHDVVRLVVAGGHVHLEGNEPLQGAHDVRIAERRAIHLPAGEAPVRLEVEEHVPALGDGAIERVVRERLPRDGRLRVRLEEAA